MIKIFTLLNLAGLFLFNMLVVGDVGITQDMPATMQPGSEVRVTVTVNKDKISGFAKLQIDLPAGLTATAIETKGASFTFADGKAKFIWMALPTQPSFKVSYTLSAASDASGTLPVTARLSYIDDNERKTVDMAPATITINGSPVAATPAATDAAMNDVASAATGAPVSGDAPMTAPQSTAPEQGPGRVSARRTITPVSDNEMLVEVTVDKGTLRGFGKLEEHLPEGFTAIAKSSDDAIFTTKDNIAKFVWLNLPSKDQVVVSYRLLANGRPEGTYSVDGEFGYLMNDLTQRVALGSTSFQTGAATQATAQEQTEPPATTTAPETTTPPETTTAQQPTTTEQTTSQQPTNTAGTVTAQTSKPKLTSTPAPEKGITYKVQITAAHREVGHPYFIQRHHYSGDFSIEHNEGWIKYVTGSFDAYRGAREQRQSYITANYNFPGPFVTAYNNGERITVQEALMIAHQHSAQ